MTAQNNKTDRRQFLARATKAGFSIAAAGALAAKQDHAGGQAGDRLGAVVPRPS